MKYSDYDNDNLNSNALKKASCRLKTVCFVDSSSVIVFNVIIIVFNIIIIAIITVVIIITIIIITIIIVIVIITVIKSEEREQLRDGWAEVVAKQLRADGQRISREQQVIQGGPK